MRVVCDNCGATYKIPEHKLSREVNKATCRKCGHTIIIRRPGVGGPTVASQPPAVRNDGDSTQISSEADLRARAMAGAAPVQEEYVPPTVVQSPAPAHGDQTMPRADVRPPTPQRQAAPPRVAPRPPSQAPSMAPAAPAPVVGVPLAQAKGHDPSGDLVLVMAGCFAAIVGVGLMAANLGVEATTIGLAVALVASVTNLMVLITSDRGRKPAKPVLSMFLGLLLASLCIGTVIYTGTLTPADTEPALADATTEPDKPVFPIVAPPVQDPIVDPDAPEVDPDEEPVVAEVDPRTERPEPTVEPKVEPRAEPKAEPKTEPRTSPRVEPRVSPKVEPKVEPKSTNVGVPVTVLDTMLKSNKGVKTCFGKYRQETGSLPSGRITVRITVQPTGKATSAKIAGGAYADSSLDTCLGGAIRAIQFPPWDGSEPATYNYPFIL